MDVIHLWYLPFRAQNIWRECIHFLQSLRVHLEASLRCIHELHENTMALRVAQSLSCLCNGSQISRHVLWIELLGVVNWMNVWRSVTLYLADHTQTHTLLNQSASQRRNSTGVYWMNLGPWCRKDRCCLGCGPANSRTQLYHCIHP